MPHLTRHIRRRVLRSAGLRHFAARPRMSGFAGRRHFDGRRRRAGGYRAFRPAWAASAARTSPTATVQVRRPASCLSRRPPLPSLHMPRQRRSSPVNSAASAAPEDIACGRRCCWFRKRIGDRLIPYLILSYSTGALVVDSPTSTSPPSRPNTARHMQLFSAYLTS
jgi:hypothetical protein